MKPTGRIEVELEGLVVCSEDSEPHSPEGFGEEWPAPHAGFDGGPRQCHNPQVATKLVTLDVAEVSLVTGIEKPGEYTWSDLACGFLPLEHMTKLD